MFLVAVQPILKGSLNVKKKIFLTNFHLEGKFLLLLVCPVSANLFIGKFNVTIYLVAEMVDVLLDG